MPFTSVVGSVHFTLPTFNTTNTMDVAGSLDGYVADALEVDATGVYYIKQSVIQNVFRFSSDSYDINDISSNDILHFIDMSQWPTELLINPVNAMMDKDGSTNPIMTTNIPSKNLVKHDFIRYLALNLFKTAQGVDLFNNESELISSMNRLGNASFSDISANLWKNSTLINKKQNSEIGYGLKYVLDASTNWYASTNNFDNSGNICRELLRQVIYNSPARLTDISNLLYDNTVPVPIIAGDSISYKFEVFPATNQHNLTQLPSEIPSRKYAIKLIVIGDDSTFINTVLSD